MMPDALSRSADTLLEELHDEFADCVAHLSPCVKRVSQLATRASR